MRAFFDSNILVYALATDDADRKAVAWRLVAQHAAHGSLVISTQVLLETFNVLTRKKRAAPADALGALRLLSRHEVVAPSADVTLAALELSTLHKLSIWDGLIVQAALQAGCDTLFSEDLQAGRRFGPGGTLAVVNPFDLQAHEPQPVAPAAAPRQTRSARSAGKKSTKSPSSPAR